MIFYLLQQIKKTPESLPKEQTKQQSKENTNWKSYQHKYKKIYIQTLNFRIIHNKCTNKTEQKQNLQYNTGITCN